MNKLEKQLTDFKIAKLLMMKGFGTIQLPHKEEGKKLTKAERKAKARCKMAKNSRRKNRGK